MVSRYDPAAQDALLRESQLAQLRAQLDLNQLQRRRREDRVIDVRPNRVQVNRQNPATQSNPSAPTRADNDAQERRARRRETDRMIDLQQNREPFAYRPGDDENIDLQTGPLERGYLIDFDA